MLVRSLLTRLPLVSTLYSQLTLGTSGGQGFVITGPPGAGKTAIAIGLEMRGERVVHEAAIAFIDYHKAKGIAEPVLLPDSQEQITRLQLAREAQVPGSTRFFMDRSVIDGIAFLLLRGYSQSSSAYDLIAAADVRRYNKKVFLIKSATEIHGAGERRGVIEPSREIEEALRLVYVSLGFEVVDVPFGPLDDRIDFILKHAENAHSILNIQHVNSVLQQHTYLKWSFSNLLSKRAPGR